MKCMTHYRDSWFDFALSVSYWVHSLENQTVQCRSFKPVKLTSQRRPSSRLFRLRNGTTSIGMRTASDAPKSWPKLNKNTHRRQLLTGFLLCTSTNPVIKFLVLLASIKLDALASVNPCANAPKRMTTLACGVDVYTNYLKLVQSWSRFWKSALTFLCIIICIFRRAFVRYNLPKGYRKDSAFEGLRKKCYA